MRDHHSGEQGRTSHIELDDIVDPFQRGFHQWSCSSDTRIADQEIDTIIFSHVVHVVSKGIRISQVELEEMHPDTVFATEIVSQAFEAAAG
jgi:hypothetical protein